MISWGIADFLQSISVRKLTTAQVMFISNIFWLILVIPFAFFIDLSISLNSLIAVILGAIIQLIALVKLYEAMKIGEVSIVIPISASYPIISVLLLIFLLGNKLKLLTFGAIVIMTLGIALASTDVRKLRHIHTVKGVKEAVIALLFFGIYFFVLELLSTDVTFFLNFKALGPYTFFFYTSFFNGLAMVLYGFFNKGKIDMKKAKTVIPYMIVAEIIYLIAWIGLTYGFSYGDSAIVTAISSLFPAITIVLALIFYKEKLVANQYFGILMILAGLFIVSI